MDIADSTTIFDLSIEHTDKFKKNMPALSNAFNTHDYYCLYFPFSFASEITMQEQFNLTGNFHNTKVTKKKSDDYSDGKIKQILHYNLQFIGHNKRLGIYVFFGNSLIFCQNLNNCWFLNILIVDQNIMLGLYEKINPSPMKRKLSKAELEFINIKTGHCHIYENRANLELIYNIINLALDDSLAFKNPRDIKASHRDSLRNSRRLKRVDLRSEREKNSYEARGFLINKNPRLELFLSFIDMDIDFFIEKMRKIITRFDDSEKIEAEEEE